MKFADKEAEESYRKLVGRYGYVHINSKEDITIESIGAVEKIILEIDEEEKEL